jgi:SAM-dependent methyltransferase
MKPEEYEVMYRVEDAHWWYRGMEAITRAVLDRAVGRGRNLRILDAGCGTGAVMGYLADYGQVSGLDYAAEALHFCQARGRERLCRASVLELPYADASFDLVVSFDVLCVNSVPDDEAALREFARVLAPAPGRGGGGYLLLRLPAYNWLRGHHDTAVDIRHRYTRGDIAARLRRAGLEPVRVSYANMLLLPVAVAKRTIDRLIPGSQNGSDLTIGAGIFNEPLRRLLSLEARPVARVGLPFGLTVVALAQKRKDEQRTHALPDSPTR